ncbi:MAG: N-acetyltransferase [Pseudomonadota bacterium]
MISIRDAGESDAKAIREILVENFPSPAEADLVEQLRVDGEERLSLVAVEDTLVVGYCMFSEMQAPFRALGLGPVSAARSMRGRGVGSMLIKDGLRRVEAEGWHGVFVLGNPEYYGRFGFRRDLAAGFQNPYAGPYFLASALGSDTLPVSEGTVSYPAAFAALD